MFKIIRTERREFSSTYEITPMCVDYGKGCEWFYKKSYFLVGYLEPGAHICPDCGADIEFNAASTNIQETIKYFLWFKTSFRQEVVGIKVKAQKGASTPKVTAES
jgi:hypothetical protein